MRQVTHPQQHVPPFHVPSRWLALAVALVAVGAVTFLVVSLLDEDTSGGPGVAVPAAVPSSQPGVRYDGGPEEGLALSSQSAAIPGVRPDGGPEEGSAAISPNAIPPAARYDGGPEEGAASITPSVVAPVTRYDGGPEEGTWAIGSSESGPTRVPQGRAADRFHHRLP